MALGLETDHCSQSDGLDTVGLGYNRVLNMAQAWFRFAQSSISIFFPEEGFCFETRPLGKVFANGTALEH
mgnify:CR=1 FL=1